MIFARAYTFSRHLCKSEHKETPITQQNHFVNDGGATTFVVSFFFPFFFDCLRNKNANLSILPGYPDISQNQHSMLVFQFLIKICNLSGEQVTDNCDLLST